LQPFLFKEAPHLPERERQKLRGEIGKSDPDFVGCLDRNMQNKNAEQRSKNLNHGTPPEIHNPIPENLRSLRKFFSRP
jgi:hypothetical protein